ncbi:uncharacterized protein BKCO1_1000473 [Diplodia corticola]|uniref:Uncharacterized protein n=1 Tax=Diplodia corticola TaxID=236234 RepID=A0A1J9RIT9_9PEZI|nr:uncharacterized protein BKCO1_1000473 [Diplodia corticola]OJD40568.1 hypothetical protein BKCO1_1000473 [Diplodia corticola]
MAPSREPSHQASKRNTTPSYTCGVLQIDCGGGYCCPLGQVCFASTSSASTSSSTTWCRLAPGIPGTDQPALLAPGAVDVAASHSTATTTTTTTTSSSSSPPPITTPPTPTQQPFSPPPSTSAGSGYPSPPVDPSSRASPRPIAGTGVAGIVIGVVLLGALLGGSAWSLWRRRRREKERAREDALLAGGLDGGGDEGGVKGFLKGGGGGVVVAERERERRGVGMGMEECEGRGLVDMYAGCNVGKVPGEVPGRVEVVGDGPLLPSPTTTCVVSRKPLASASRRGRGRERGPVYEMDGTSPLARTAARGLTG